MQKNAHFKQQKRAFFSCMSEKYLGFVEFCFCFCSFMRAYYTTTRDFRELQQPEFIGFSMENYTTTIDFSELQFVSERKAPQGKRLHGL